MNTGYDIVVTSKAHTYTATGPHGGVAKRRTEGGQYTHACIVERQEPDGTWTASGTFHTSEALANRSDVKKLWPGRAVIVPVDNLRPEQEYVPLKKNAPEGWHFGDDGRLVRDAGKKGATFCGQCQYTSESGATRCPHCGGVMETAPKQPEVFRASKAAGRR